MSRKIAAVLCILALIFALSAHADSSWKCEKCGRHVESALGDTCPYCGAHRHVHVWREATCTEPKTCKRCDETEGEALGHEWREATCTEPRTCLRCRVTDGEALGHQWDEGVVLIAANCQSIGVKRYTCAVCGTSRLAEIPMDPANHAGGTEIRFQADATCTEDGYTGDTYCKSCGGLISAGTVIPTSGHQRDEGTVIQEANCQTFGIRCYTCKVCGMTRDERIPKDSGRHVGGTEIRDRAEATCTSDGYTGDTYCKGCGELMAKGSAIAALGHQWDKGTVLSEATCQMIGAKSCTCTVCGAIRLEEIPKDPANHAGGTETRGQVNATCTGDGYTGDTYCKGCGKLISKGSATKASGHKWGDIQVRMATCRDTGLTRSTCTVCGTMSEETVAKDPTNHSGGTEIRGRADADCTGDGYTGDTYCKGCGQLIGKGSVIPALGHSWQEATYTAPKTCARCGATEGEPLKKSVEIGDILTFGHYPQTASGTDSSPIEWIVLDVQGSKALLLSKYGVNAKQYNTEFVDITWETCSLRKWLNGEFLNAAFSASEQKDILPTNVDNSKSQGYDKWDTDGGNDTNDKVFLLSYTEAYRYLRITEEDDNNMKSRVAPTAYAKNAGSWTSYYLTTTDGDEAGWWYLRSPGINHMYVASVSYDGSLSYSSNYREDACARPTLWINLESDGYDLSTIDNAVAMVTITDSEESRYDQSAEVGDVITFGHYSQTASGTDSTPIEWIVLDVQGSEALLLSKHCLDNKQYHTEKCDITWEECSLRKWLNGTFINKAFSNNEQRAILLTFVDNSKSQGKSGLDTNGGNNTQDRVFLLSYEQANRYLGGVGWQDHNVKAAAAPTAYARAAGGPIGIYHIKDGGNAGWWWLRSPGHYQITALEISDKGSMDSKHIQGEALVRPALWVDLGSGIL